MTLYTIPSHEKFLPVLIKGLERRFVTTQDPLSLARIKIFLPTRRAVQQLRTEFLAAHPKSALLLPQMIALGDVDPGSDRDALISMDEFPFVPPAINIIQRQTRLAELIMQNAKKPVPYDHALHMAFALANLLDEMITADIAGDQFEQLVPREFAEHWELTLDLLKILTGQWPAILKQEGKLDPTARRNKLIEKQIALWQSSPPQDPVIIAGALGNIPAVAKMMQAILSLPQGAVILPGLDQELDAESWQNIGPTHAMGPLKNWLDKNKLSRSDVTAWHENLSEISARASLWRSVLRPALSDPYSDMKAFAKEALENLTVVEASSVQEEAEIIALKIREVLEGHGRTAMIITPDRNLATRIRASLRRYDIRLDDSMGQALSETALGSFFDLTAQLPQDMCHAITLLSFLKHPLTALGCDTAVVRTRARKMEIEILRGARAIGGLSEFKSRASVLEDKESAEFLDQIEKLFHDWIDSVRSNQKRPLHEWLKDHVRIAETIAATDLETGGKILWHGDAGDAIAQLFRFLLEEDHSGQAFLTSEEYHTVIMDFMRRQTVRARFGTHPRVRLLSPIESRLQHADIIILAGLNESSWPEEERADPWLSRPMRRQIGLPTYEDKVGVSAHDFVQAATHDHVFLTRAVKDTGAPTVRTRWLERLHIVLKATGQWDDIDRSDCWRDWIKQLDQVDRVEPTTRPRPRPPLDARPRKLSVSSVELWRRDPYSLYAKEILKLKPLPELDEDPDARLYGNMMHQMLQDYFSDFSDHENAKEKLLELAEIQFKTHHVSGSPLYPFWREKFAQSIAWIDGQIQRMRASVIIPAATECSGEMNLSENNFTIYGRADLINRQADGSIVVVDYKTGRVPTKREQELGYSPQLPLLSLVANKGGFKSLEAATVAGGEYWDFKGNVTPNSYDLSKIREDLQKWIALFDRAETAYISVPHADFAPSFEMIMGGDYRHLARVKEWSISEEDTP